MKIGIINLGCPKNTVDMECMLSCLNGYSAVANTAGLGPRMKHTVINARSANLSEQKYPAPWRGDFYSLTTSAKDADIILINTCAFLKEARDESNAAIRDMFREKKKGAKVIVAGCFVSKDLRGLKRKFPGVHAWLGVNDMMNIGEAIAKGGTYASGAPFVYKNTQHTVMLNPYSAYVKISDGCNHTCSFCVIPQIKGRYRSRKIEDIAAEVKNLTDAGIREINLISQDLTYFGRDNYGTPRLAALLRAILKKTKKYFWLRLLYLYPDINVIKKITPVMEKDLRLCRYIDVPFQHVNDRILKSMKRGYGKKKIMKVLALLRAVPGGATIRSSFIAGYPGETEKEFTELMDFIGMGLVDKAGVFGYSDEPGTYAYTLPGKLNLSAVETRKKRLLLASSRVYYYNNKRQLGLRARVLITGKKRKGVYLGRTQENAPDIDSYITVKSGSALKTGVFYDVMVEQMKNYELEGEAIAAGRH